MNPSSPDFVLSMLESRLLWLLAFIAEGVRVFLDQEVLEDATLGHETEEVVVTPKEDMQTHLHRRGIYCCFYLAIFPHHTRSPKFACPKFACL